MLTPDWSACSLRKKREKDDGKTQGRRFGQPIPETGQSIAWIITITTLA
jgi:hypothetical protein